MGKNKKGEPKTQKQIPNQWIDFIENLGEPIGERNQKKEKVCGSKNGKNLNRINITYQNTAE